MELRKNCTYYHQLIIEDGPQDQPNGREITQYTARRGVGGTELPGSLRTVCSPIQKLPEPPALTVFMKVPLLGHD